MSEFTAWRGNRSVRTKKFAIAIVIALFGALLAGMSAAGQARADEPKVPEDVAAYFATGLIPRLADLYGSPSNSDPASTFDDTTKVGTIHRLLAWTPAFLAGQKTDTPTELTNTWVAPVTAKSGTILGLAAVWINPGSDQAELADFSRGRALVDALGRAPKDTQLINDTQQQAWFATDGKTLTPLVAGKSGTREPLTVEAYQKMLVAKAAPNKTADTPANPGLVIASITLGAVVLLLAVFILLPGRGRKKAQSEDAAAKTRRNPRQSEDKAFDRQVTSTEARAKTRARAAVSAEAALVEAMADSDAVTASDAAQHDAHGVDTPARLTAVPPLQPEPSKTSEPSKKPEPSKVPEAKKPAVKKPAPKKPAAKKPAPQKPVAKKSAPKSTTTESSGGKSAAGKAASDRPSTNNAHSREAGSASKK